MVNYETAVNISVSSSMLRVV